MTKMQNYQTQIYLDLAMEAKSLLQGKSDVELGGVSETVRERADATIHEIRILNDRGAAAMGRPIGSYITIDSSELRDDWGQDSVAPISGLVADELIPLLPPVITPEHPVLVVGLGNLHTTPDALGPQTAALTQPTTHIWRLLSDRDRANMRAVAAIAPGVLGNTGIPTYDTIKGVVDAIKPSCIIAIDALATASVTRICNTIQLCNTGIQPGSGISRHNKALTESELGVPVIAIGIPTVVHAGTIINEAIEKCLDNPAVEFTTRDENLIISTINELLNPYEGELLVTPKGIDEIIPHCAKILAAGIARACHPGANRDNYHQYMQ